VFYFSPLPGIFSSFAARVIYVVCFLTHILGNMELRQEKSKEKVPVNRSWFVFSMRMLHCLVWELQISTAQSNCRTSSTVGELPKNFNLEYMMGGKKRHSYYVLGRSRDIGSI